MGVMFRDSLVVADVVINDAIADSTEIDFGDFSSGAVHGFVVTKDHATTPHTNTAVDFYGAFESGGTFSQIYEEATAGTADAVVASITFDKEDNGDSDITLSFSFPDACFAFPFVKMVWRDHGGTNGSNADQTVTISLKS